MVFLTFTPSMAVIRQPLDRKKAKKRQKKRREREGKGWTEKVYFSLRERERQGEGDKVRRRRDEK